MSSETPEDGSFPPWPTHTPVVSSMLTADLDNEGRWAFDLESVTLGTEIEYALERIDSTLKGRSAVTFNGRGFDLPTLMLTAQKARAFDLPNLTAAATENRFWSARHYDLADKISGYGAARGASLARLCEALQIPVKEEAHGSDVGALYARGDLAGITRYCETDVAATLLAYANQRAMETGDKGYHASLTWQFARWAGALSSASPEARPDGRSFGHLAPYAVVDDDYDLQRLSLLGQIDAHIEAARVDAERQRQNAIDAEFNAPVLY